MDTPLLDCLSAPHLIGVALSPPGSTLGPRHPRGFELVWMIEGSADYEHGERRVHAPEGSVVLCRADVPDTFAWDAVRGCRHAYVQFELLAHPAELPSPEACARSSPTSSTQAATTRTATTPCGPGRA